jgi:desumoylating isopeptidase 1
VQSEDFANAPYNIQSVSLQLACNLFSSTVFQEQIYRNSSSTLRQPVQTLVAQCLLSPHLNARSMAAALLYDLTSYLHNKRIHDQTQPVDMGGGDVSISDELSAALLESITSLSSLPAPTNSSAGTPKDCLHALLLALGTLLYGAPAEEMLWDLCRAMELREVLQDYGKQAEFEGENLIKEVGEELLRRGGY